MLGTSWGLVGQRDIPAGAEAADVGAVFVLNAEYGPHATPKNFENGNAERGHCRVLDLQRSDCVENPVAAQNRVHDDSSIVPPNLLVGQLVSKKRVLRMGIAQAPVIVNVPKTRINAVDYGKGDENRLGRRALVSTVDAQACVEHNGSDIFPTVEEMREFVARVPVPADALEGTPNAWQCYDKAHDLQVMRVAMRWVFPVVGIKTSEQRNIAQAVRKRTEHVAEIKVTPFNWVDTSE